VLGFFSRPFFRPFDCAPGSVACFRSCRSCLGMHGFCFACSPVCPSFSWALGVGLLKKFILLTPSPFCFVCRYPLSLIGVKGFFLPALGCKVLDVPFPLSLSSINLYFPHSNSFLRFKELLLFSAGMNDSSPREELSGVYDARDGFSPAPLSLDDPFSRTLPSCCVTFFIGNPLLLLHKCLSRSVH